MFDYEIRHMVQLQRGAFCVKNVKKNEKTRTKKMPKVERMYEEGGGVSTICTYQQNSCESVIFFVCVSNRHTILSEKMAENCSV